VAGRACVAGADRDGRSGSECPPSDSHEYVAELAWSDIYVRRRILRRCRPLADNSADPGTVHVPVPRRTRRIGRCPQPPLV